MNTAFWATEYLTKCAADDSWAAHRAFNRQHNVAGPLVSFLTAGPVGSFAVARGLENGADSVTGFDGFAGSSDAERALALQARNASGVGSYLKAGLPVLAGTALGGAAGIALGDGPDGFIPGALAGSIAGTVPAYYMAKSIGRRNAEEAVGR